MSQRRLYKRIEFSPEEAKCASIHYDLVERPGSDYVDGEITSAVLRNCVTGRVEIITFRWSGYLPGFPGTMQSVTGHVIGAGPNAYVTFNIDNEGRYVESDGVFVSFAGNSASTETFERMTAGENPPASFTGRDVFRC